MILGNKLHEERALHQRLQSRANALSQELNTRRTPQSSTASAIQQRDTALLEQFRSVGLTAPPQALGFSHIGTTSGHPHHFRPAGGSPDPLGSINQANPTSIHPTHAVAQSLAAPDVQARGGEQIGEFHAADQTSLSRPPSLPQVAATSSHPHPFRPVGAGPEALTSVPQPRPQRHPAAQNPRPSPSEAQYLNLLRERYSAYRR